MKTTFQKIKKIYQKDTFLLWVILLSLVFFVFSSALPYFQVQNDFVKFFSPDENANYNFTKLKAEENHLILEEELNLVGSGIVIPRSYRADGVHIKPVSFLGMTLVYSSLAKVFGTGIIPFLTPFFAAIALVFYYLLIKLWFGKENAFLSFLIFLTFPVLIYYSARSMFHNVLFLSFLIIGVYFLVVLLRQKCVKKEEDLNLYIKQLFRKDFLYSALSGLFIGLAVAVRASELIWLFIAAMTILVLKIRRMSVLRIVVFLSFFFLALLPVFYHNQVLYGSPFYGGYNEMNSSIESVSSSSGAVIKSVFTASFAEIKELLKGIFYTIFYFGFYPEQSYQMFNRYVIDMFWYLFWPALFAVLAFVILDYKKIKNNYPYFLAWLFSSVFLVLYYGSWKFVDNPDASRFTIGNSYTRYWLPLYIGIFPFVSYLILKIASIFKIKYKAKTYNIVYLLIASIAIFFIAHTSLVYVYRGSEEGLVHYPNKLLQAKSEVKRILELTEDKSVIITEYHDKFLFPERKIIVARFNDLNINDIYARIINYAPLYYYNFTFSEIDMNYLNDRRLKEAGLRIELVETFNDNFSLYKLERN